jgi:hypothetical protein
MVTAPLVQQHHAGGERKLGDVVGQCDPVEDLPAFLNRPAS